MLYNSKFKVFKRLYELKSSIALNDINEHEFAGTN